MIKFIYSSFLILLLLEIVTSANPSSSFSSIKSDNGFTPSTDLHASYSQQTANSQGGFHKADIFFKTKMPSLNPDQSGVSNVNCDNGKITLGLTDDKSIEQVNSWPDQVMLLISDNWQCFGKTETQFYMVSNKTIDTANKSVSFTSEPCKVSEQSEEFLINVSWVNGGSGGPNKRKIRRRLYNKRDPVDLNKKLNLDILFDENTGKSSKPNIPLIDLGQSNTGESLVCSNCFMNGEATINMIVGGKFFPTFKLTDATISINGNVKINLDIAVNGKVGAALSPPDIQLLTIPLSPLSVQSLFNIGPSIDLIASAKISTDVTGTVHTGGEVDLPNFSANVTFVDTPTFVQSGFEPQSKPHDTTVGVTISADIAGSLKPQLSFGIELLAGLFTIKTGFQVITTLGASISVGSESGCNNNSQPHLDSTINGDLGFFVESKDFPIVNFPPVTLLSKCV
ncbi:hypothetical protein C1645_785487 [Glomus cerebriforme]|uniref:Uncharacterized protein n=1 Tax=Glomus cerebriforme TaxID=658196 RepID=A0A397SCU4_9GLOM|nr:hypothetical protein C1645_785487 [Glomus cerebriforme]